MKQNPKSMLFALLLLAVLLSGCPKNKQNSAANNVTSTTNASIDKVEFEEFCAESGAAEWQELLALLRGFRLSKDRSGTEMPGKAYIGIFDSDTDRDDFLRRAYSLTGRELYRMDTERDPVYMLSDGASLRVISWKYNTSIKTNGKPGLVITYMDMTDQQSLSIVLQRMDKVPWQ
ncbi:MAG: hypothetical protein H7A35_14340 [Planctomycetales bacterium]|nr:hypothetical protein [bacterium]UNM08015.1 MAG: hypothetical protein H7A35_14340 [Planctomycetales bacterium]